MGQRLDKILSNSGFGTRREIKELLKTGYVKVDGIVKKDGSIHIDPDQDEVNVDGTRVNYREFVYIMMNKPAGVLSATEDRRDKTVLDLLDDKYKRLELSPVGRLDKDTEGLMLLTNNGKLVHELISPKKHVPKTYFARIRGKVTSEDVDFFSRGVILDDGYKTLPGELSIINSDDISEIELTIYEGKFHQVKRMFKTVDKEVIYLKRLSIGKLVLDKDLQTGQYRELTDSEISSLTSSQEEDF